MPAARKFVNDGVLFSPHYSLPRKRKTSCGIIFWKTTRPGFGLSTEFIVMRAKRRHLACLCRLV